MLFVPGKREGTIKSFAFSVTVANLLLSLMLYHFFSPNQSSMQFQEIHSWIPRWGIWYRLGVDGFSLFLVILTTFLSTLAFASSWRAIDRRVKEFAIFMLLLETGMIGVFCATDLFLFYVFWEATLVPMYFVIGIWGGPQRIYAAVKFFLYTMAGSMLMLVAILVVYFLYHAKTGVYSFSWEDWQQLNLPRTTQLWLFGAFAVAMAIKVPMLPFHTWLPDAHVEAPTAGSVILAAILLKMGSYGFVRFCIPFFPTASIYLAPLIGVIAVAGIIYGGLVAAVQTDVKKLVAYSSVSHMGFVMLGIFALTPEGMTGATLQMVNHGLSTGALFLIVGMLYERRHTRLIGEFGGISKVMPIFSAFFLVVALSSLGLPGLNGFVGEFLVLAGSFVSRASYPNVLWASFAATGVVLAAIYLLWMFRRVMHGPITKEENRNLKDLGAREIAILAALVAPIVFIGVHPQPFLSRIEPATVSLVERVWPEGMARVSKAASTKPPLQQPELEPSPWGRLLARPPADGGHSNGEVIAPSGKYTYPGDVIPAPSMNAYPRRDEIRPAPPRFRDRPTRPPIPAQPIVPRGGRDSRWEAGS